MVFQSYALFPHMSVFENVAFGLRRRQVPRRPDHPPGRRDPGDRRPGRPGEPPPRELSGGQQQRVALARALVNHPRALLLDEPLGALDLKLRQAMQVELKRIQREVGITFVYVTHDQGEALTMSDRIAVMNDGLIEHLGTPRQIYEHPASRFVAGFIGTSNLLTGEVSSVSGGEAVIAAGDGERIVVSTGQRPAAVGDELEVTVRPEKIRISRAAPGHVRLRRCAAPSPRSSTSAPRRTSTSPPRPARTSWSSSRTPSAADQEASDAISRGDGVWLPGNPPTPTRSEAWSNHDGKLPPGPASRPGSGFDPAQLRGLRRDAQRRAA